MGRLYDACQQVIDHIDQKGLDVFRTRGLISMRTGFPLVFVTEDTPDDEEQLKSLISAARDVLDIRIIV